MKRRTAIVSTAALVALGAVLIHFITNLGGWSLRIPQIEAEPLKGRKSAAVAPAAAPATPDLPRSRLPAFGETRLASTTAAPVREPPPVERREPEIRAAGAPYWCFRTYFPGQTWWMMDSDARNTGNAARLDSQYIWNGSRSLRLDFSRLLDAHKQPLKDWRLQRNVLWQAIRAAPFRGKRIVFRPTLRAMSGGTAIAFLRSWDGRTDAPRLAHDRNYPLKTPTAPWSAAWGSPRLLLDVPEDAEFIYYGIVHVGNQPVWIDHVEVDADPFPRPPRGSSRFYEASALEGLPALPMDPNWVWDKPQNLDFEIIDPDENGQPLPDTPPLPC